MSSQKITPGQVNPAAYIDLPTTGSLVLARWLNARTRSGVIPGVRSRQSAASFSRSMRLSPQ